MKKFVFLVLSLLALAVLRPHSALAATSYYVNAATGSDSASGSSGSPFKTMGKALGVVQPGDTLHLTGTFGTTTVSKSGTSGNPIYIRGTGAKFSGGSNAAFILTGSYLDISGVEVEGGVSHGLLISGKNITVSNFSVHDNVLENKSGSSCVGSGGWGSGLKLMVGAENITIQDGVIYHNCGEGFAVTRGLGVQVRRVTSYDNFSANFYLDNSKNVTLEQSFTYCTGDSAYYRSGAPATGILIGEENYSGWGAQLENMTIQNTISSGCKGLNFYGSEVNGGLKTGLIAHNTVWNVYGGGKAINIAAEPNNSNIRVVNNLVQGSVSGGAGVTMSHNGSTATFVSGSSTEATSFRLAAGSGAIDAGTDLGIATDFAGASRLQGSAPDLGAYEYGGAVGASPVASVAPSPSPSPNPSLPASLLPSASPTWIDGDFNHDHHVSQLDYSYFLARYGNPYTIYDYNDLVANYGRSN
jgi:hypothetical protein